MQTTQLAFTIFFPNMTNFSMPFTDPIPNPLLDWEDGVDATNQSHHPAFNEEEQITSWCQLFFFYHQELPLTFHEIWDPCGFEGRIRHFRNPLEVFA